MISNLAEIIAKQSQEIDKLNSVLSLRGRVIGGSNPLTNPCIKNMVKKVA